MAVYGGKERSGLAYKGVVGDITIFNKDLIVDNVKVHINWKATQVDQHNPRTRVVFRWSHIPPSVVCNEGISNNNAPNSGSFYC